MIAHELITAIVFSTALILILLCCIIYLLYNKQKAYNEAFAKGIEWSEKNTEFKYTEEDAREIFLLGKRNPNIISNKWRDALTNNK